MRDFNSGCCFFVEKKWWWVATTISGKVGLLLFDSSLYGLVVGRGKPTRYLPPGSLADISNQSIFFFFS